MDERRKTARAIAIASTLLAVSLVMLNGLTSVHLTALDLGFYRAEWASLGAADDTGMSMEDLSRAGRALIDCFAGRATTPQVVVTIHGERRQLYNPAELAHLEDVRLLFKKGFVVEQVLAAEAAIVGIYLWKAGKTGEGGSRRAATKSLAKSLSIAAGVSLGLLIALAVPANMSFTGWWTIFHVLTFSNELWRLDPATDWLIRMFPEEFFFSAVKRIGACSCALSGVYACLGLLVRHFSADHRH